ncbi:MAG: TldD/PmbA family protein [Deltaproteobacteria bacterium]|nr:TldD/PmbA family protein [Deltaproteobacteria bacterium]
MNRADLELCREIVELAGRAGAAGADAMMGRGSDFDVTVRDGKVEEVSRATDATLGVRVFLEADGGRKLGFLTTSALPATKDEKERLVRRALGMAEASAANPWHGLPDAADTNLSTVPSPALDLFDPRVAELGPEWAQRVALQMEQAACAAEPRIHAFSAVGAGAGRGEVAYANTLGFSGQFEGTHVSAYCSAVTLSEGGRQSDGWSDARRHLADLMAPEDIAKKAAERVSRAIGARPGPTGRFPVIFEAPVAMSIIGHIAAGVNGDLVAKNATFLQEKRGQPIAPAFFQLVDDSTLPRAFGSVPFDGEGLATRVNPLVTDGVLQGFLYDAFTARRLGARPTGSARRGPSSLPGIGTGNIRLAPGERSLAQLVKDAGRGLLVTRMLGHGPDMVTGDYSRGAAGLWIEHGEIAHPVEEMTVAGNLLDMLRGISAVGADLLVRGGTACPSIMFGELAVSSRT